MYSSARLSQLRRGGRKVTARANFLAAARVSLEVVFVLGKRQIQILISRRARAIRPRTHLAIETQIQTESKSLNRHLSGFLLITCPSVAAVIYPLNLVTFHIYTNALFAACLLFAFRPRPDEISFKARDRELANCKWHALSTSARSKSRIPSDPGRRVGRKER